MRIPRSFLVSAWEPEALTRFLATPCPGGRLTRSAKQRRAPEGRREDQYTSRAGRTSSGNAAARPHRMQQRTVGSARPAPRWQRAGCRCCADYSPGAGTQLPVRRTECRHRHGPRRRPDCRKCWGGSIEDYAREVAIDWGVGDSGADNGVLVVADTVERELRIETADGVRELFYDDEAENVIENVLEPAFADE